MPLSWTRGRRTRDSPAQTSSTSSPTARCDRARSAAHLPDPIHPISNRLPKPIHSTIKRLPTPIHATSDPIPLVAESQANLTDALGIRLVGPEKGSLFPDNLSGGATMGSGDSGGGPNFALGMHTARCKRAAFLVEGGVIKVQVISEGGPAGEFDPAGDDHPQASCIENVLKLMSEGQPTGQTGSTKK